jgi:hypothetical protein
MTTPNVRCKLEIADGLDGNLTGTVWGAVIEPDVEFGARIGSHIGEFLHQNTVLQFGIVVVEECADK